MNTYHPNDPKNETTILQAMLAGAILGVMILCLGLAVLSGSPAEASRYSGDDGEHDCSCADEREEIMELDRQLGECKRVLKKAVGDVWRYNGQRPE